MGISLLESEYSQYLHSVSAKESVIRTTFGLIGIFNFVGKVISGNFLDRAKEAPLVFSFIGNICMLLAYASLGTLPYWPLSHEQRQWIMMATSPLLSCGFVFIYTSTFSRMYNIVESLGNAVDTTALISGWWRCPIQRVKKITNLMLNDRNVDFQQLLGNVLRSKHWWDFDWQLWLPGSSIFLLMLVLPDLHGRFERILDRYQIQRRKW